MSGIPFVNNSPISVSASAEPVLAFTFSGSPTLLNASAAIYLNGKDTPVTSTCMPTGTASIQGSVVVTPVIKNLKGGNGNVYTVAITVTVDGVKEVRKCDIRVQKDGAMQ
jgi:hypothetical protein